MAVQKTMIGMPRFGVVPAAPPVPAPDDAKKTQLGFARLPPPIAPIAAVLAEPELEAIPTLWSRLPRVDRRVLAVLGALVGTATAVGLGWRALAAPAPIASAPAAKPRGEPAIVSIGSGACQLFVDSRPAGASVFIDGRAAGITPAIVDGATCGHAADVTVRAAGHADWQQRVVPSAADPAFVVAALVRSTPLADRGPRR